MIFSALSLADKNQVYLCIPVEKDWKEQKQKNLIGEIDQIIVKFNPVNPVNPVKKNSLAVNILTIP
jgi:hypothetical protein